MRSPRFRLALALFVVSHVFSWPAVAAAASASPWIGTEVAAVVGSVSYAVSWLMIGTAAVLGGREVAVVGGYHTRRLWARLRGLPFEE